MKNFKGVRGTVVLLILMFMLVGYYFYLSNRSEKVKEEPADTSQVQEVLLRDLSRNYPATPKEVIKYYSEITKCFYNEEYSEDELKEMADQAMRLYDDELAAYQAESTYLADLKSDIASWKKDELKVSSYKTSNSTDVDYFTKDGYECARIFCTYTLRKGTNLQSLEEVFILRKDADGHWKIFGWKAVDPDKKKQIEE